MNVQHIITFVIFTFVFKTNILAQEKAKIQNHSINVEAFGKSILWGTVNYEYQYSSFFSLGAGFGYTNFGSGQINRIHNDNEEIGQYWDLSTSQMLYANYFLGKNKHQLLLTGGLTNFWAWTRQKFPSETIYHSDTQIRWNFGLGYQYSKNSFYFRTTAYVLRMPEPTGWFPKVFPWIGISLGYKF